MLAACHANFGVSATMSSKQRAAPKCHFPCRSRKSTRRKRFSWFVCPLLTVYRGERAEMSSFPLRKSPPPFSTKTDLRKVEESEYTCISKSTKMSHYNGPKWHD